MILRGLLVDSSVGLGTQILDFTPTIQLPHPETAGILSDVTDIKTRKL